MGLGFWVVLGALLRLVPINVWWHRLPEQGHSLWQSSVARGMSLEHQEYGSWVPPVLGRCRRIQQKEEGMEIPEKKQ